MAQNATSAPPVSAQVTAFTPIPVGTVITYSGNDTPNGWLPCDGRGINSNDYPRLCGLVGNNVPDLRSRFIVGAGSGPGLSNYGLGNVGGEERHHLSIDELPAHGPRNKYGRRLAGPQRRQRSQCHVT